MTSGWLCALMLLTLRANSFLEEGRQFYRDMFYEQAAERLRVAVGAPNISREERREAFDLLARSLAAQGRLDDASQQYARLLEKDPGAPGPLHAAPKIRLAYQQAKERLYPHGFVQLTLVAVSSANLELRLVDPWQAVHEVVVFQAPPGAGFEPVSLSVDGTGLVSGRLDTREQPVRYYGAALDPQGAVLASLGSPKQPLSYGLAPEVRVDPGPKLTGELPVREHSRWPAWALGAVAVAAAGTATALAIMSDSDSRASQKTGVWTVQQSLYVSARNEAIGADVAGGVALVSAAGTGFLVWRWQ